MTPETPLTEVAHLLPQEIAAKLMTLPQVLQVVILTDLRTIIAIWEQSGVSLDPITFSKVIAPVTEMIASLNAQVVRQMAARREES